MPKVKINGVTFEADSQEDLDKAVATFSKSAGQSKAKSKKPKPEARSSGSNSNQPSRATAPKKLSPEDLRKAMATDPYKTISEVVSAELGFDLKQGLQQFGAMLAVLDRDFSRTAATLALERAGAKVTDKSIEELMQITNSSKGKDANASISTLTEVAKEAVENEWIDRDPKAGQSGDSDDSPEGASKTRKRTKTKQADADEADDDDIDEADFPTRSKGRKSAFSDSDEESPSARKKEAEIEKTIREMEEAGDEADLMAILSGAAVDDE